jgi:rubrerythrin
MSAEPAAPKFERTCRYAHGALKREDGVYKLNGVEPNLNEAARRSGIRFLENEKGFVLQVWVCQTCGYIELVDQP